MVILAGPALGTRVGHGDEAVGAGMVADNGRRWRGHWIRDGTRIRLRTASTGQCEEERHATEGGCEWDAVWGHACARGSVEPLSYSKSVGRSTTTAQQASNDPNRTPTG